MTIKQLLTISRPRFWMYTVGPFLVGIAATGLVLSFPEVVTEAITQNNTQKLIGAGISFFIFLTYLRYFMFPANLLIYGVNDIADGDTDQHNKKKEHYESRFTDSSRILIRQIIQYGLRTGIVCILLAIALSIAQVYPTQSLPLAVGALLPDPKVQGMFSLILFANLFMQTLPFWLAFFATSIGYSLPPIRAKAKPFLDGVFNVLYIIPGLIAYLTFGGNIANISWIGFGAGRLRCIAMHTYSAIPDIEPDSQAGLTTTAVFLGEKNTLRYCALLWIVASFLGSTILGPIILVFGCIYLTLVMFASNQGVMRIYKRFPIINACIGFILFWMVVFL